MKVMKALNKNKNIGGTKIQTARYSHKPSKILWGDAQTDSKVIS
jgi:hypothetical protein